MFAQQLSHFLKLQQLTGGQDETGEPVQTWQDVDDVWADVRFLNGTESIKADAEVAVARCSVRILYRTDVTAGMRFLEGSTVYEIESPPLPARGMARYIDLACKVGANNG